MKMIKTLKVSLDRTGVKVFESTIDDIEISITEDFLFVKIKKNGFERSYRLSHEAHEVCDNYSLVVS